ncbi:MAG: hypothetical protein JO147_02760 [Actinobacteria bacterium]|nr:hypothetical protein [Actinomycetota bacterium]
MNTRIIVIGSSVIAAALAVGATSLGVAAAGTTSTHSAVGASRGQIVVIDATQDKDSAVNALKLFRDASDRSFTPTGAPVYSNTSWAPAQGTIPDKSGNYPVAPSVSGGEPGSGSVTTNTIDVSHESNSSWSLGGSIEESVGFNLMDIVDVELSAKFTANHTWENGFRDFQSIEVTADEGKTVWVESSNSDATYTGNFAFNAGGIHYEVDNVSFTQPVSDDQSGDSINSTMYKVVEVDSSAIHVTPSQAGHTNAIDSLPKLQQYIAAGH